MLEYFRFKEIHDLYTKGHVEDARQQLSELQARYVNLCDENALLRTQIQGYEDILHLSRSLIFDGIFFWLVTGSIKQGPFCPVCYNRDGLLLRLSDDGSSRHCLTCGSQFNRTQAPVEQRHAHQAAAGMAQGSSLMHQAVSRMTQGEPGMLRAGTLGEIRERVEGRPHKATIIPFAR